VHERFFFKNLFFIFGIFTPKHPSPEKINYKKANNYRFVFYYALSGRPLRVLGVKNYDHHSLITQNNKIKNTSSVLILKKRRSNEST